MRIYDQWIDFVNLRCEEYTENSRIPTMVMLLMYLLQMHNTSYPDVNVILVFERCKRTQLLVLLTFKLLFLWFISEIWHRKGGCLQERLNHK